jgi:4-diphosphocytidyl-2-C-methyl-D-erythritol kinase
MKSQFDSVSATPQINEPIKVSCAAKLNLSFEILNRLENGFHEIRTLFQSINLEDELVFSIIQANNFEIVILEEENSVSCPIPLDQSNLIAKAIIAFKNKVSIENVRIHVGVKKNIPIGAGLAGGSADAAATLIAMNRAYGNILNHEDLFILASNLGADVSFSLIGGTATGTHYGEELTPHIVSQKLSFLIVKPRNISVSTAWMYEQFDQKHSISKTGGTTNHDRLVESLKSGDFKLAAKYFGNDFEPVAFSIYPQLEKLKNKLLDLGSWSCHLTGSGPSLFALVADREMGHAIRHQLLQESDQELALDVWISQSIDYGVRFLDSQKEKQ